MYRRRNSIAILGMRTFFLLRHCVASVVVDEQAYSLIADYPHLWMKSQDLET